MSVLDYQSERDTTPSRAGVPVVDGGGGYTRALEEVAYSVAPAPQFDLTIERDAARPTVRDVPTGIFGCGDDLSAALRDFRRAAQEHLEVLEEQEALSDELARQLRYLRARIGLRH